ncbi:MAG: glycosyltransferase family 2 protein [Rhodanobacter sp.]
MPNSYLEQVTVVCVTYHSRSVIAPLAAALKAFPNVVVIDNGSRDGTANMVRHQIPQARLIERNSNIGFGAANNEAMAQVHTPFALLLNPDSSIELEDLLVLLDTMARYPNAAAVAPQSWQGGNIAQRCFRQAFYKVPRHKGPYQIAAATCCVEWLHGCCLLLRTDSFKHIGGFDESFFLYYEDDDLCLRLRQAGFTCLFEPAAMAKHLGGASSPKCFRMTFAKAFHYARSRHLAINKYMGSRAGKIYLAKTMLAAVPATLIYGILWRQKYTIRWAAWGCAAVASAFGGHGPGPKG